MSSISIIVRLTLYEARRLRVLTAALLGGFAFLLVFGLGIVLVDADMAREGKAFIERQAIFTMLTIAGLYATNFLSVLLAVLLPVDALSGEIDSGVMQTVASKPIRRADIVLGKWLGHSLIVCGYLALLAAGVLLITRVVAGHMAINVPQALALIALEVVLLVTVSIAGGTCFNTVTNGVAALGFYGVAFIGGWVEQIGGFVGVQSARSVGIAVSLISPPDALWRMAAYHMQPSIVRETVDGPPLFLSASVPNLLMVWWAVAFTTLVLLWAIRSFERRAL